MGDSEVLAVRFHFNGVFVVDGSSMEYCNGDEGVSHIDKDKLSIPKLEGYLQEATSTGKDPAASSSTKSTKRKAIEGYGLYYSERSGSSYIQTGKKSRLVSFGTSNSKAKASVVGNASVVIETSAGHPTSSAKATINVTGGCATAKITSTARGRQKKPE